MLVIREPCFRPASIKCDGESLAFARELLGIFNAGTPEASMVARALGEVVEQPVDERQLRAAKLPELRDPFTVASLVDHAARGAVDVVLGTRDLRALWDARAVALRYGRPFSVSSRHADMLDEWERDARAGCERLLQQSRFRQYHRAEIARYLRDNDIPSEYAFGPPPAPATAQPPSCTTVTPTTPPIALLDPADRTRRTGSRQRQLALVWAQMHKLAASIDPPAPLVRIDKNGDIIFRDPGDQ